MYLPTRGTQRYTARRAAVRVGGTGGFHHGRGGCRAGSAAFATRGAPGRWTREPDRSRRGRGHSDDGDGAGVRKAAPTHSMTHDYSRRQYAALAASLGVSTIAGCSFSVGDESAGRKVGVSTAYGDGEEAPSPDGRRTGAPTGSSTTTGRDAERESRNRRSEPLAAASRPRVAANRPTPRDCGRTPRHVWESARTAPRAVDSRLWRSTGQQPLADGCPELPQQ